MPLLTSALATAVVMLPFVIAGGRPGLEVVHPMAVVVLGGLATSILLSLFVLPTLYLRFGGRAGRLPRGGSAATLGRGRARAGKGRGA